MRTYCVVNSYVRMTNLYKIVYIRGNLANVLQQVNLPFNMILSYIFLHAKYKRSHLMGAILVLYGGLVCMIPIFNGEVTANMPDPSVGWISLYIISMVPCAASNGKMIVFQKI